MSEAVEHWSCPTASNHATLQRGQRHMAKRHSIQYPYIGKRRAHVVIAERALGKPLPVGAEVHHVDEDVKNNRHSNLVICQDHAYHRLLHARRRIVLAGGDPNTQRICSDCRQLRPVQQFSKRNNGRWPVNQCRVCRLARHASWYSRRRNVLSDQLCECGCGARTYIRACGRAGTSNRFVFGHNRRLCKP